MILDGHRSEEAVVAQPMQATLNDKTAANDDPKSTLDKLESTSEKRFDGWKQQSSSKHGNSTISSKAASSGDGKSVGKKNPENAEMGESSMQDATNKKEKKEKQKDKSKISKEKKDNEGNSSALLDNTEEGTSTASTTQKKEGESKKKNGDSDKRENSAANGASEQNDNTTGGEKDKTSAEKKNGKSTTAAASAQPPPPVMRGTLSLDPNGEKHVIRGMWNYENSTTFPPQRFELVRTLGPDEDKKKLPVDGVFHGSFSLAYVHVTSKGKQKERSKVIQETGVDIKFTPIPDKDREYKVDGKGTNQFGIFHINGTAEPSKTPDDPTFTIILRKRYEPGDPAPAAVEETKKSSKKSSASAGATKAEEPDTAKPLPEPAKSFESGVVALRGKLYKEESSELGTAEVVHRINGWWAAGLDLLLADPQNIGGLCNRFEYEHKSSVPSHQFPVSGRYSGWFDLSIEDGTKQKVNESDVTLKFRLNNAGYHNIEGKGSNVFGKYTITGTLTLDNVITIFREFQPRKLKTRPAPIAPPSAPLSGGLVSSASRRPSVGPSVEGKLKLEDVEIPPNENGVAEEPFDAISPPASGQYSAVSRGVLRKNEDGSHSCQGKWAVTREHFTSNQTSNFNFRLEPHFAAEAIETMKQSGISNERQFPADSASYKGSFQMKKQGSRFQTIVDQQIVMKFRKNKQGSFNVYGTGINAIGEFSLIGTLILNGKTGGQVELFRIYKPDKVAASVAGADDSAAAPAKVESSTASVVPARATSSANASISSGPPERFPMQRRESSRMSKLPSRLEEDNPNAQLSRVMEKCTQILKFMREMDTRLGAFFSQPVDPVALGIPTYYQVIKEPMDLKTVHRKMEADEIDSPEEFIRLVRLVFENAMTFNIDPAHSVHQAARSLLVKFNEKIKDVERTVQTIRKTHGLDIDGKGKKKGKDDKKRKRHGDETRSLKRQRFDEAQAMVNANASAISAIVAAAPSTNPSTVSRTEFNLLLNLIQQLQGQIVATHTALAELTPGDPTDDGGQTGTVAPQSAPVASTSKSVSAPKASAPAPSAASEKKSKGLKRKSEPKKPEPAVVEDDPSPLSIEEQQLLTDTINELPQEHLGGVIAIIREAAPVGADEDEIDLEIDQLDHRTQRKLLKHVSKFVKKSKPKQKKKQKPQPEKKAESSPPAKKAKTAAPKPKPKAAATTESFFSFGGKDGSDSDSSSSDDEDDKPTTDNKGASNDFQLAPNPADLHNDDSDDEDEDEFGGGGIAGNWNITQPATQSDKKDEDKDNDWAEDAKAQAKAAKALADDKKAREEKKKKEAEEAREKAMAEAAQKMLKEKEEKKEMEMSLQEQQKKDKQKASELAREQARREAQAVEQVVDLDAQRDIMKQLEQDQSFLDNDSMGGASPSSDFGF